MSRERRIDAKTNAICSHRVKLIMLEHEDEVLRAAIDMGIPQNTLSGLRSKKGSKALGTLLKFAKYYGVSLDYLCGRTDNPEVNK